jgi:sialic acid synthase SpsE
MRLILDVGSTHGGSERQCLNAIDRASEIGVTDIKFQMLEKCHIKAGNIPIKNEWLSSLIDHGAASGVNVFASIWSFESIQILLDAGATTVKFAYSAHSMSSLISLSKSKFHDVIISTDVMSYIPGVTNLFCIPQYPVYHQLSFDGIFPRFHGFSDHTMGISQTIKAVESEAKIIEKHVIQDPNVDCPDGRFAITWREVEDLKNAIDFLETK